MRVTLACLLLLISCSKSAEIANANPDPTGDWWIVVPEQARELMDCDNLMFRFGPKDSFSIELYEVDSLKRKDTATYYIEDGSLYIKDEYMKEYQWAGKISIKDDVLVFRPADKDISFSRYHR